MVKNGKKSKKEKQVEKFYLSGFRILFVDRVFGRDNQELKILKEIKTMIVINRAHPTICSTILITLQRSLKSLVQQAHTQTDSEKSANTKVCQQ